ncbi:IS1/IS1595 family N-terminal zinc-binding domain-containing protein [Avibacterium sp. 21-586]|uniref:IS1/IS1595 family N-terminal zinc-binding domain-containing protein n=1 Tax=Avibacterium sp. 21-586 TaxID=2911534 RepID=UPI003FA376D2
MKYEPKNALFAQVQAYQKYGKKNGVQRYTCTHCHKTFSLTKRLNSTQLWYEYTTKKQTYQQLA